MNSRKYQENEFGLGRLRIAGLEVPSISHFETQRKAAAMAEENRLLREAGVQKHRPGAGERLHQVTSARLSTCLRAFSDWSRRHATLTKA